jgi:hypothetical protein
MSCEAKLLSQVQANSDYTAREGVGHVMDSWGESVTLCFREAGRRFKVQCVCSIVPQVC